MIPTKDVERMAFWLSVHKYKDAATMLRDLISERSMAQGLANTFCDACQRIGAERDAAREEVGRLREAVEKCAAQFSYYAAQHRAKSTADADEKARTNDAMVSMCRAALTGGQTLE